MLGWVETYISTFQFNIHRAFMRHKLAHWGPLAEGKLLDVGAGDKPYQSFFTKVVSYIGTNTKRHYGNQTATVEKHTDVWIEDAGQLPFDSNSFDAVCCFQVLSVVPQPERFFAEAGRVLSPGGLLYVTTDFLYAPWSTEDRARYTATQLSRFAAESGFEIKTLESFGGFRCLNYSLYARYVRSYADTIKQAKGLRKLLRMLRFAYFLSSLPAQSVRGWFCLQLEKNKTDETDFTFNYLLVARKIA